MRAASVEESALRSSDPSEEVRAFYESHPYPPPLGNLDRHRELYRDPGRRQALSLLLWPARRPTPDRKILIAGCGTSQAVIHAMREPDAQVTAIDISESSLSHTRDLQREIFNSGTSISGGSRSKT